MRLRTGPGFGFSCWETLYPLVVGVGGWRAAWGKHTLTALPADAICPTASISLREGQSAVPPPRGAAASPDLAAAHGKEGRRRRPRTHRLVLRSAPAIRTAAGTMKVSACDSDCVLHNMCVRIAPVNPQRCSWQKGARPRATTVCVQTNVC